MEHTKDQNNTSLWYVGYGSNLCHERFVHYVKGGGFRLGGKPCIGCRDKTFLNESKPIKIPHGLFFANNAQWWENGGVAFLSLEPELDENNYTYGRMWKITRKQFSDVWDQEGRGWYDKELNLGQDNDSIPIVTITSSNKLESNTPSDNYLKTMSIGLKETYHLDKKTTLEYLIEKPGIKNNMTKEKLLEIINSN